MNKLTIYYFLLLLQVLLAINEINGQTTKNFFYHERAYLQVDRDIYVAGENLFFKLYLFNSLTNKHIVQSRFAYLVLRNAQNTVITGIQLKLENSMSSGSIYLPDTLSTGSYQLVSYTNCMRNYGEESFFTRGILIVNRFDKELNKITNQFGAGNTLPLKGSTASKETRNKTIITLIPEKNNYLKREKIRIGLEATGMSTETKADLSISVCEATPISNDETSISSCFKDTATIGSDKNLNCIYFPEIKGAILQGKIINPENRQPISNTTVFLSSPDTIENLQLNQTGSSGDFCFLLNSYYNDKELFLRLPKNQKAKIELDNKFEIKKPFKPNIYYPDSSFKKYLLKSQNIVQVQKTYHSEMQKELPVIKTTQELPPLVYPPVLNSIYPADFVEISREILPLLKIRKRHNQYVANMLIENERQFYDFPPLIFLDGVPIDDINQVISLGSEKVKRIETIGSKRYYGDLYFYGILAVFSKTMEINNVAWTTPTISVKSTSNQLFLKPLQPDYSEFGRNSKYIPDFRQLLYWEPNFSLKGGEKKYIEFYASDNTGEFDVKVEGMVIDGAPVCARIRIKIMSNITR